MTGHEKYSTRSHSYHIPAEALKKLHESGIQTYVFLGPLLPMDPYRLAGGMRPYVNNILIDRVNYTNKAM